MDINAIIERARVEAQKAPAGEAPNGEREKLKRVAQEFESMLLLQVLKDMRKAGWEEEGGADSLGAESLFETIDVELASHLARVKGMGLGKQLEEAFDRMNPGVSGVSRVPGGPLVPGVQGLPMAAPGISAAPRVSAPAARQEPTAPTAPSAPREPGGPDVVSVVTRLVKPVAGAVTSAFGWRRHPITNEVKFHQGVDLRAAYGQEVQAAAAGRVVFSGDQGGYGTTVMVEHADGTRTRYAHLSARLVKNGDQIAAGEPLGRAGKSGHATGTHLHFEVIAPDGRRIAPDAYVASGAGHTKAVRLKADTTYEPAGRNSGQRDGLSAGLKVSGGGAD